MLHWCFALNRGFLLSSVLLLLHHLPGERDGVQVRVRLLLLPPAAPLSLGLGQRVHHGHVHVQVVGLFETLPAHQALELQVGLGFVFGHVVL